MGSEYISRSRFSTGPTPCTGWGRKTSSGRTRLSFGLDRHLRTENIQLQVFTGQAGWWCPPQFRRVPPWRRTFGKAARSCRTKSESQKIFIFSNVMHIATNMFGWTCLLPVPADVLLRHWRVEQEVCVVKEGRDRRWAPALWFLITQNDRNPYQSPLVEGNSGGTVDIRPGEECLFETLPKKLPTIANWVLRTWQKAGKWVRSRCQV